MFERFNDAAALSRLLISRDRRLRFPGSAERRPWEALSEDVKSQLLRWGEEARAGYPMLPATRFLAYAREGDRQAWEKPYFQRRERLMGAALAACVREDAAAYLDAVIDGLWCICEETSWVISAHNGSSHEGMPPACERPLPDTQNPYIDLFAAQTAATLAYVIRLLGDRLDRVSPLIVRRVKLELERRIFLPFFNRDDFWWMGMIRRDINNWTPWILSNIIDSLLLVMDDGLRAAQGLIRAMRMLDRYIETIPADGGCDEGCAYWNMAGASLFDCLDSLYHATDGAIDLFGEPKIQAIGRFPLQAHIHGPWYWNFADCDAEPHLDGSSLCRYGERVGDRDLMALGQAVMKERTGVRPLDTPQMNRVLWTLFGTWKEAEESTPPEHIALPDLQVYAWRRGGWYAAIKGGHNGESHNHNDAGSFLLYLDGQPQFIDAGNLVYTAKTFGPERYTLWNTRSMYHNVPLIGGIEQHEGREYAARVLEADERGAALELAGAYPEETGLLSLVRHIEPHEDGLILHDHAELAEPSEITWVFMLAHEPQYNERASLMEAGEISVLLPRGAAWHCEEIPVTDPRMARNYRTLWRVSLTYGGQTRYDMKFDITRRSCRGKSCTT